MLSFSKLRICSRFINNLATQSKLEYPRLKQKYYLHTSINIWNHHKAEQDKQEGSKTVSEDEVKKFRELSSEWWNLNGPLRTLHSMNTLRVPFVRNGILSGGEVKDPGGPSPLGGVKILDVGCGGGILCEPLARLGAQVTGLDVTDEGLEVARARDFLEPPPPPGNVSYVCQSLHEHVPDHTEHYDAVIASEVLEHVTSVEDFLEAACAVLRPGGRLFVTTINKTALSYLGAVVVAERVLGLLPQGTHEYDKFVPLSDLCHLLTRRGLRVEQAHGMSYNTILETWSWSCDKSINYAVQAVKL